jgi:hypothetical protein
MQSKKCRQWKANFENTFTYNSGANYPNLSEGVGPMLSKKKGCNVLAIVLPLGRLKLTTQQTQIEHEKTPFNPISHWRQVDCSHAVARVGGARHGRYSDLFRLA